MKERKKKKNYWKSKNVKRAKYKNDFPAKGTRIWSKRKSKQQSLLPFIESKCSTDSSELMPL